MKQIFISSFCNNDYWLRFNKLQVDYENKAIPRKRQCMKWETQRESRAVHAASSAVSRLDEKNNEEYLVGGSTYKFPSI